MVRGAAKNHACVAVVTSADQYDALREALAGRRFHAGPAAGAGHGRFRAHGDVRRSGRVLAGQRGDRHQRRHRASRAGSARPGTARRCCATARTRTSARRCIATGSMPGGLATAQQLHGKEMSYNNYVDADAARRAAYDFDEPAVAIIKHAESVRDRGGLRHRRRACQGARLRPGVGVRRGDRDESPGERGDGRAGRGGVHRGDRGAGVRGRRRRRARAEEEHPDPGRRAHRPWRRRDAEPIDGGSADAEPRHGRRPPTTPRRTGSWWPATLCRPRCWRISSSPGRPAGR